jgi:hypothetical protein
MRLRESLTPRRRITRRAHPPVGPPLRATPFIQLPPPRTDRSPAPFRRVPAARTHGSPAASGQRSRLRPTPSLRSVALAGSVPCRSRRCPAPRRIGPRRGQPHRTQSPRDRRRIVDRRKHTPRACALRADEHVKPPSHRSRSAHGKRRRLDAQHARRETDRRGIEGQRGCRSNPGPNRPTTLRQGNVSSAPSIGTVSMRRCGPPLPTATSTS